MKRIQKVFLKKGQRGCGSGVFFIKEKQYLHQCIEHDNDYVNGVGVLDRIRADVKFVCEVMRDAIKYLRRFLKGVLYCLVVILFGWFIYFISRID